MTNDLRGHVVVSRTVPMGQYSSLKVEVMEEYILAECTFEEKFDNLAQRLKEKLTEAGVVRE